MGKTSKGLEVKKTSGGGGNVPVEKAELFIQY